jgi:hypothetical protein
MTEYKGRCHCGQVEWTAKVPEAAHILWSVECPDVLDSVWEWIADV